MNLRATLMYGLTAYLALYNMLGLTHRSDWLERLEGLSSEKFRDWLDRVQRGGAVHG